jgi:hypothetical protein
LKNIHQFKVQVMPDQQLAGQAAAGNVVPIGAAQGAQRNLNGVGPGSAASTETGLNAMGA